jgi:uncharacterized RDD family membrane protein YckC
MAYCTNCGAQTADAAGYCGTCGSRIGAGTPPTPPPPTPWSGPAPPATPHSPSFAPGMTYAQWIDRVIGYLIDSLLVGAVMGILYLLLGTFLAVVAGGLGSGSDQFARGACCMMIILFPVSTLLVGLFNHVYLVAQRGASIGQGVMKLKVVDGNGNLLSTGTALLRLLARIGIGLIPFGTVLDLLWPLWDDKRQTLHDKAVGSFVLKHAS